MYINYLKIIFYYEKKTYDAENNLIFIFRARELLLYMHFYMERGGVGAYISSLELAYMLEQQPSQSFNIYLLRNTI